MDPKELRDFEDELRAFSLLPIVPPQSHDGQHLVASDSILKDAMDSSTRAVPTLHEQCSLGEFNSFWSIGMPLVVKLGGDLQCDWSPISLATLFGSDKCSIVDCEDRNYNEECLVDDFLRTKLLHRQGRILKLKVSIARASRSYHSLNVPQDYPSDTTLRLKASELARDFNSAVPVSEYCSDSGPLNIANHFPINYSCVPDLGELSNVCIESYI